jgi:hypothetical protein
MAFASRVSAPVSSDLVGVAQPASGTQPGNLSAPCAGPPFGPSWLQGVGQPESQTVRPNKALMGTFRHSCPSLQSRVVGVGQLAGPVGSVPDVRRTDARRRERDTPEGVIQGFHVSVYKVDPRLDSFCRNLLSKDFWRAALADEVVSRGPQVPLVSKPIAFACRAERLARTGAGPDSGIVADSSLAKGKAPDSESGEKVDLGVSSKLIW